MFSYIKVEGKITKIKKKKEKKNLCEFCLVASVTCSYHSKFKKSIYQASGKFSDYNDFGSSLELSSTEM